MKSKIAIGCLTQWYEIEILSEYIDTLIEAVEEYDKDSVLIDLAFCVNQSLERIDDSYIGMNTIMFKFNKQVERLSEYNVSISIREELTTISDYRREFNTEYCTQSDVLVWGETDLLVPKKMFVVIDSLHQNVPVTKYVSTFGICKMWDDSWKGLEHPDFTDKPFIENDYDNWWSVKYTMTKEEMNKINSKTEQPEVVVLPQHKFNGCGLVISSEVIRSGVNIPQSVFFVHEDTALMFMTQKILGNIPQYSIRNILNVHNRNHPKKRRYVKDESGDTMNQQRRSNDWYVKANKFSEENCYNLFNPTYKSKTWSDIWKK
jgi:hypothetical protein